jgi:hypothetical protein
MSKKDKETPQNKMQMDMGDKWRQNDFSARPEAAGRKSNPYKCFLTKHPNLKVSAAEIQQAMEVLLSADRATLHGISDDPQAPFAIKVMAQQMLRSLDSEDVREIETIIKMIERTIDRIAGKAPQHITVTQENNAAIDVSALTEEELLQWTQLNMKISQ